MQIKRGALVATGLFALIPLSTGGPRLPRVVEFSGPATPSAPVAYSTKAKEFYMTADEIGYIRPGFHITVNSITIPGGPAPGRGLLLHRRPEPAARPPRPGHARTALDLPGARLVGRGNAVLHGLHDADPDVGRHVAKPRCHGHAGRRGFGRDLDRPGARALDLPLQDGPAGGLRPDEDAHARDLRHPEHVGHPRTRTTTTTSCTTSARTAARSPSSGTRRSTATATSATTRSRPTAAPVRTSSSASRATTPRRSIRTRADRSTSGRWSTRSTAARTCRASRPARPT